MTKQQNIMIDYYGKAFDAMTLGVNQTVDNLHVSMDMFDPDCDISDYTKDEFIDMCIVCHGIEGVK